MPTRYAEWYNGVAYLVDATSKEYLDGGVNYLTNRAFAEGTNAPNVSRLEGRAPVDLGIYNLVEQGAACDEFFDPSFAYALTGPEFTAGTTVTETRSCTIQASQTIYDARMQELADLLQEVLAQGVTVTLPSNGVRDMPSSGDVLWQYTSIGFWTLPLATQVATRDLWRQRLMVAGSDMPELWTQIGLLYATALATEEGHEDNLIVLRDADDQQGLADYDITTGWPAAPEEPAGLVIPDSVPPRPQVTNAIEISALLPLIGNSRFWHNGENPRPWPGEIHQFVGANFDAKDDPQELLRRWEARPGRPESPDLES